MNIVVLYCQHCAGGDGVDINTDKVDGLNVWTVMVPCSSKVQASDMLKIIADEADGLEIVACPESACRFLVGSRRAEKRVNYVRSLLEQAGLNQNAVGITRKAGLSVDDVIEIARNRAQEVSSK